jgi:hypothetical protein
MSIGPVGPSPTGWVAPPAAAASSQNQDSPSPEPYPQKDHCSGHNPPHLADMSTETFMSLKAQAADGPQSTLDGLKKILEIVAMTKLLEAMQQA